MSRANPGVTNTRIGTMGLLIGVIDRTCAGYVRAYQYFPINASIILWKVSLCGKTSQRVARIKSPAYPVGRQKCPGCRSLGRVGQVLPLITSDHCLYQSNYYSSRGMSSDRSTQKSECAAYSYQRSSSVVYESNMRLESRADVTDETPSRH